MSRRVVRNRRVRKSRTLRQTLLGLAELYYRRFVTGDSLYFFFVANESLPCRNVGRPITFVCDEQGDREESPLSTASRWQLTAKVLQQGRKGLVDAFYVVKRVKLPDLGKEVVTIQPCKIMRNILRKKLA